LAAAAVTGSWINSNASRMRAGTSR
jgi:hypothetical protein